MSYIRCLNNPESLYVFGSSRNTWFYWRESDGLHREVGIPCDEIDKFFLELYKWETFDYNDLWTDNPFSHGNMSVVECGMLTGKKDSLGDDERKWKIKLTFGPGHPSLFMWGVTWEYLKDSFYEHIKIPWYSRWYQKLEKWFKKRRK